MSENKLHFETLQLHVGQEEADAGYRRPRRSHLSDHFLRI